MILITTKALTKSSSGQAKAALVLLAQKRATLACRLAGRYA